MALDIPDYSQYISYMTGNANTGLGNSNALYNWAQGAGTNLSNIAGGVSGRAGSMADFTAGQGTGLVSNWEQQYGPLYAAQTQDANRLMSNLPATEEQYAGKYGADASAGFDAAKAAQTRQLTGYGLKAPGVASQALDMTAANQRAAGTVAAEEQGRLAARTEARGVTQQAIQTGMNLPQVGTQEQGVGLAAGNQQINAPESAISTTAGAYQPSLGYYSASYPYAGQWGSTMGNAYNQQLAQYNAQQNSGGGVGALVGTIGGGIAGSFFGPMGTALGSSIGGSLGGAASKVAKGGMIPSYAVGGPAGPHFVPPDASPSKGAITDDVPAQLNAGEFVFPKDVVAWRGESWMQKEIQKAREDRQKKTIAAPESGPPRTAAGGGAISTGPPAFVSEGARA